MASADHNTSAGQSIPNIIGNLESQDNSSIPMVQFDQVNTSAAYPVPRVDHRAPVEVTMTTKQLVRHVHSKKELLYTLEVKGKEP